MDKSWRVIAAFVGIFAAGAVTGGLLTLRIAQSRSGPAAMAELPPVPAPSQPPPANVTVANGPATAPASTETAPVRPAPTQTPTQTQAQTQTQTPPPPEQLGPQLFRRLTNQLGLTQEQRVKIRPIERRTTEELNRLRRDTLHSTEVLIDRNEDEIRALLNPAQAAKFDELVAQQRTKIQKFMAEQQEKRQREQREKVLQGRGPAPIATPASEPKK